LWPYVLLRPRSKGRYLQDETSESALRRALQFESCVRRSKRRPAAHACSTTRETKTHLYLRMWATWRLSVMNMRMKKYMTRMGQKTGTSKTGMHDATIENVTALVAEYLRAREK